MQYKRATHARPVKQEWDSKSQEGLFLVIFDQPTVDLAAAMILPRNDNPPSTLFEVSLPFLHRANFAIFDVSDENHEICFIGEKQPVIAETWKQMSAKS